MVEISDESTTKVEEQGKKKAPSKSKSHYGDIFHLYESQSGEQVTVTPVTENKKQKKYFSSRMSKSSTVHPPIAIEEGKKNQRINL